MTGRCEIHPAAWRLGSWLNGVFTVQCLSCESERITTLSHMHVCPDCYFGHGEHSSECRQNTFFNRRIP